MGINFGDFKKKDPQGEGGRTTPKSTPQRPPTVPESPKTNRRNYKKDYEKLLEDFKILQRQQATTFENFQNVADVLDKLKDENVMLREQERQLKEWMDITTQKLALLQFNPREFGDMALVLGSLHVNANIRQKEQLDNIVGSHLIADVRKWIIDILSKPYDVINNGVSR